MADEIFVVYLVIIVLLAHARGYCLAYKNSYWFRKFRISAIWAGTSSTFFFLGMYLDISQDLGIYLPLSSISCYGDGIYSLFPLTIFAFLEFLMLKKNCSFG